MLAGSPWMPESPRWLALMDRYDDCLAVLKQIHGNDQDDSDSFYAREFHQIRAQMELEKTEKVGVKDIFVKASYRKRVLLIMAFYFFQQYVFDPRLELTWTHLLNTNFVQGDWNSSSGGISSSNLYTFGDRPSHVSRSCRSLGQRVDICSFEPRFLVRSNRTSECPGMCRMLRYSFYLILY